MTRFLWPLGLAALLASPLVASAQPTATDPPAPALTLDEARQLAAARSLVLSAAQHGVDAADGGVRQAGARRNPELTTTVEDLRAATRVTTVTLGLPLELGGQRTARVTAAERARDLAAAQRAAAGAQVRADVVAHYVAVVAAQERVAFAEDAASLAARAADVVAQRVAAGKVSPVDATRAQVDAANAGLDVADARAELATARQALAALWGDAEPRFARVDGTLAEAPSRPPVAELLRDVDSAPSLVAGQRMVDARDAAVDVERRRAVPDVVVSLGARRDNQLGLTQAVVGVTIPLPVFDRNAGATIEAAQRAGQARDEAAAARVALVAEVGRAATQLESARAAHAVLRETVLPAARQAYEAATAGFEAGKFGFLDVIDAQRALLQARVRTLDTLVAAWQAAAAIDRLLGR